MGFSSAILRRTLVPRLDLRAVAAGPFVDVPVGAQASNLLADPGAYRYRLPATAFAGDRVGLYLHNSGVASTSVVVSFNGNVGTGPEGGAAAATLTLNTAWTLNGQATDGPLVLEWVFDGSTWLYAGQTPNTMALGSMAFTGNLGGVQTTFPGQGAFVPIGNGNGGTHPLFVANPNNQRFTVVGAQAPDQVVRYDAGERSRLVCVRGGVSLQNIAVGAQGFDLRITQNGASIPNASLQGQTGGLVTTAGGIFVEAVTVAAAGDEFALEIANETSGTSLIASSAQLTIGAG